MDALVRAGSCKHESRTRRRKDGTNIRRQSTVAVEYQQPNKARAQVEANLEIHVPQSKPLAPKSRTYTQEEFRNLLDYYRSDDSRRDEFEAHLKGNKNDKPNNRGLGGRLDRDQGGGPADTFAGHGVHGHPSETAIEELQSLVDGLGRLVADEASPQQIFDLYSRLPQPGILHLTPKLRRLITRRLSVLDNKNPEHTLNYLSLLDDYTAAGLRIPRGAWNSAISLGGNTRAVQVADVELALRLWKAMENEANVTSDVATFNILFDIAAKAGKFALADMVLDEMRKRKHKFNRFTMCAQIFSFGLRGDGEGVRVAYRHFVEQGEIVDTVILNCVIASLLNAGEPQPAEAVFSRMRRLAEEKEGKTYEPRLKEKQRELGRIFDWVLRNSQFLKEAAWERVQSVASLAPDARTCNLLISHFCRAGELHRTAAILDEMEAMRIVPNNWTFRALVKGFVMHGGVRYSTWTSVRLESIWQSYKASVEVEELDLYLDKAMAFLTLAAFRKCCGAHRALEVWEELRTLWKLDTPFEQVVHPPRDAGV